jgi:hypothetical protein
MTGASCSALRTQNGADAAARLDGGFPTEDDIAQFDK